MENIITYDTLRRFCYSSDRLIRGDIRGIVLMFHGLNNVKIYSEDPPEAYEFAEQGIVLVIPYNNPWGWMNSQAVGYTDEILSVIADHYSLGDGVRVVSTGRSMGGLAALVYCAYARVTPVACVANCPVCDLVYHMTEREDLPRTLYSAFYGFDGTMDEALRSRSPLHLVDRMPHIPYTVFHCKCDKSVNMDRHSERFYAAMKDTHDISLIKVDHRGHCDLSPEALIAYREAILRAFE